MTEKMRHQLPNNRTTLVDRPARRCGFSFAEFQKSLINIRITSRRMVGGFPKGLSISPPSPWMRLRCGELPLFPEASARLLRVKRAIKDTAGRPLEPPVRLQTAVCADGKQSQQVGTRQSGDERSFVPKKHKMEARK